MNLLSPTTLRDLCARAGMRPEKSSGQNFLVSRAVLDRIVTAIDPQSADTIIEVGAGFGVLTTALAPRVARIIAIERDRRITPVLRELVSPYGNVSVVEEDVLRWLRLHSSVSLRAAAKQSRPSSSMTEIASVASLPRNDATQSWKLAANLPYSITSDFLRLLFDVVGTGVLPPPGRAVLLLQREVVDRLVANPMQKKERSTVGMLTILAQLHCTPRRVATVAPGSFWPPPKVESAIVVFDDWRSPAQIQGLLGGVSRDEFLRLVHACFARRRAQLQTTVSYVIARPQPKQSRSTGDGALSSWPGLLRGVYPVGTRGVSFGARNDKAFWDSIGIDPTARPETLTLEQWIALTHALRS